MTGEFSVASRSSRFTANLAPPARPRYARSRLTTSFFPLIDVASSAAITWSTMSFGTSTVECRSAIWIEPIDSALSLASFTIAPTMSPGLIFSLRPPPM